MISDLWTLQSAAGGPEKTLAEWGFSGATLARANQAADVLTLLAPVADALTADVLWEWETELILRRDGEVYCRGYLADTPMSLTAGGEMITHEIRSQWWLLERLDYRQDWVSLTGAGVGKVSTGRTRLGAGSGGATAAAMLGELVAFCASMGVSLTVDASLLPATPLPIIEGHNRTVADLLRSIWHWLPDVTFTARYTEAGTQYRAVSVNTAGVAPIAIGGGLIDSLQVKPLYEMQVDKVRIVYETTAPRVSTPPDTDALVGGFRKSDALVAVVDQWPVSAPTTRRTLSVILPYPAPLTAPIPRPQITSQPVAAERWPDQGAYDNAAERWWLDRSDLAAMGFTIADILLPRTADGTTILHRVLLDQAIPEVPPSPVNPASTPVWRPSAVDDTPRELMAGALSDWMNVESAMLIAQVTIAVRKSTADALDEPDKSAFMRLGPREVSSIVGVNVPTYLIDASYKFRGTNAVTKVYSKVTSIDYDGGTPAAQNLAAYNAAVTAAKVPNLARRLHESMSPLYHAGTVSLAQEEAPLATHLGRCVRLVHPDRPDWLAMRAVVQRETSDLATGSVSITVGPPDHLAPQDWVALHGAARIAQDRRTAAASAPVSNAQGDLADEPSEGDLGANPVIGGTFTPLASFSWLSGGMAEPKVWALEVISSDAGEVKIKCGTIIKNASDLSAQMPITGATDTFTPTVGQTIHLKLAGTFASPTVALEAGGDWTDYPAAYETTGEGGTAALASYFYPLWEFVGTSADDTVEIRPGVHARRLVGDHHFLRDAAAYHEPLNRPYAVPFLIPYHRALAP